MINAVKVKNMTVVLADGDFPRRGGKAWEALLAAKRVIACDGAAAAYKRRFSRWPDYIVGDLDSLSSPPDFAIEMSSDEENDLSKALSFCRAHLWNDIVIVGATGKREDHTIANIFIALDASVPILTDCGVFHPVEGEAVLRAEKGTGVSVFAPSPTTQMTSKGLVWPLDGVKFKNFYCAASNRASSTKISLTSSERVFVFIASKEKARRKK